MRASCTSRGDRDPGRRRTHRRGADGAPRPARLRSFDARPPLLARRRLRGQPGAVPAKRARRLPGGGRRGRHRPRRLPAQVDRVREAPRRRGHPLRQPGGLGARRRPRPAHRQERADQQRRGVARLPEPRPALVPPQADGGRRGRLRGGRGGARRRLGTLHVAGRGDGSRARVRDRLRALRHARPRLRRPCGRGGAPPPGAAPPPALGVRDGRWGQRAHAAGGGGPRVLRRHHPPGDRDAGPPRPAAQLPGAAPARSRGGPRLAARSPDGRPARAVGQPPQCRGLHALDPGPEPRPRGRRA